MSYSGPPIRPVRGPIDHSGPVTPIPPHRPAPVGQPYPGPPHPGQPAPGRHPSLPAGFFAAVAYAIGYVLLYAISKVLQVAFSTGKLGPIESEGAAKTIFTVIVLLPVLVVLPAALWMARGPRLYERPFAAACSWTAVVVGCVLALWIWLPPNPYADMEEGVYFSGGSDFIVVTLLLVAWIATRRGSAWGLLVAPIGGIIAVQAVKLTILPAEDSGPGSIYEQIDAMTNPPQSDLAPAFWYPVLGCSLVVLTLVVAAWVAYGIDKAVESIRGPLPVVPSGMLTSLTGNQRRALAMGAYALMLAMLTAAGAMVYASTVGNITVWALTTAGSYALVGLAVWQLFRDPGNDGRSANQLLLWVPLVVAVLCLAAQIGLMASAEADEAGHGALFGLVYHLGAVALAAAVIAGITKRPWGIPAAALLFIPSAVALGDYARTDLMVAKIDVSGKVAVLAVVFVVAIAAGVLLNKAAEYVIANPGAFGRGQPQPYGPPPGYGHLPHSGTAPQSPHRPQGPAMQYPVGPRQYAPVPPRSGPVPPQRSGPQYPPPHPAGPPHSPPPGHHPQPPYPQAPAGRPGPPPGPPGYRP